MESLPGNDKSLPGNVPQLLARYIWIRSAAPKGWLFVDAADEASSDADSVE